MKLRGVIKSVQNSRYVITAFMMLLSTFAAFPISDVSAQSALNLTGKRIQSVETGYASACSVIEGWAYCWGANDLGQLGIGTVSTTVQSKPVAVSSDKVGKPAGAPVCIAYFLIFCTATGPGTPAVPPSAMAGLEVEKISVGATHACAIANAKVFCWGDNSFGQLGNRTEVDSPVPIKVDISNKDEANKPKSALAQKEIIDVTAGEFFTCALASDGTVACWGDGEFGRLGTGDEFNTDYPVAVDTSAGSQMAGKKATKLARASMATMCVIAVDHATFETGSDKGNPYCWGVGIGNGTIPGPGQVTVPCSKTSPTTKPTGTGAITTYFTSDTPIRISNTQLFTQIDGANYLTGLSDNHRAYYWGMHGYRENNQYVSSTTCSVNPCTASVSKITLAASANDQRKKAINNAKKANTGGGDKNTNLNGGNKADASSSSSAGGAQSSYSVKGTTLLGVLTETGSTFNINHYQGTATISSTAKTTATNVGNNKNKTTGSKPSSCANVTHYGYTANRTVDEVGKMTPTVPHASSLNQTNLNVLAGNIESGLFCATNASGTYCDANGTAIEQGQTGSNYTKQCVTTGFIFTTTTCSPAPTGPQQVVASGWLSGKTVQQLSVGRSGFTCALASNSIGCWGLNSYGQLGTGDTVNKLVPTALKP